MSCRDLHRFRTDLGVIRNIILRFHGQGFFNDSLVFFPGFPKEGFTLFCNQNVCFPDHLFGWGSLLVDFDG